MKPAPNANFTSLGTKTPGPDSPRYLEYRRQWMENPETFHLRDFPLHLDLEATNRCNLDCVFCDKRPALSGAALGDMDFSLFARILDEAAEHELYGVKFSYRGEPLLHPRLIEMVAYAKRKGALDVYFNTNAMLLDETAARGMIDAGLDRISISVEGVDPAAYEAGRRGARFSLLTKNLTALVNLRDALGSVTPRVRVQTVKLPGLDLDEYSRFWLTMADEAGAVDFNDVRNRRKGLAAPFACPQLWQRMTVTWDGDVMPCNNDDLKLLSPGSAATRSIRDCWLDPTVQKAREIHRRLASHELAACDGCPWRTTQIEKAEGKRS
ncbi:MAG: radical SAM protein [Desulfovibrionaceae bacterium]|nr:radical SAM protein [Desulfovibrionaceae bacterium]MBF0512647.1 radical SAM protein [Desulfovibrionaceae bacterium]